MGIFNVNSHSFINFMNFKSFLLVAAIALLSSCNNWTNIIPKSAFDAPFPKANKDLTNILGTKLYLKRGKDTTILTIHNTGKYNLITDKNGDTIFCGKVSQYKGLYYFSQSLTDTTYLIYAVKVENNLLYGLNAPWYEGIIIDHHIKKGEYKDLVKKISPDGMVIRLHAIKPEMHKLYTMIMDSLPPDTILRVPQNITAVLTKADTVSAVTEVDPEEYEMFSKVYPNPATDSVTIEMQEKEKVRYINI